MKKNIVSILLVAVCWMSACVGGRGRENSSNGESDTIKYARSFRVERCNGYVRVDVINPWDTALLLHTYLLVPKNAALPDGMPAGTLIRTPLERVAVCSSVHCGMMETVGAADRIGGVCEPRYVFSRTVRDGLREGRIVDLGEAAQPDMERLIELAPEAIITSPIDNSGYGRMGKLGIPIVECVDYRETSPLGRTEWLKLFGLLFGRTEAADSAFLATEIRYNRLCELADQVSDRPVVLPEMRFGSVWYVPGGRSYMANLYRDAGADYPWSEDPHTGSLSLSLEHVLERGADADVWILKYNRPRKMTLQDLADEYGSSVALRAWQTGNVWGCNSAHVRFYEELPVRPDLVLEDLVRIFQPGLLPNGELRYFHKLQ